MTAPAAEPHMLENAPEFIGRALSGVRAGSDHLLCAGLDLAASARIEVFSTAFGDGGLMPTVHTADGSGTSPPITWRAVPEAATAVLIVVEDADSPTPRPLVHLLALASAEVATMAAEGAFDAGSEVYVLGHNSFGGEGWLPPDPPPGHGPHSYVVQVFALVERPDFGLGFSKHDAEKALAGGILGFGLTHGVYSRGAAGASAGFARAPLEGDGVVGQAI